LDGFDSLTLLALKFAVRARYVLGFVPRTFLSPVGVKYVEDLGLLYLEGATDDDNYARIYRRLLRAAADYGDIAVLVPGHPRVGVTFATWLSADAQNGSIRLQTTPGVSSLDGMLVATNRDALERGTVMVDANRLLLLDLALEPCFDHYVFHVCSVGTSRIFRKHPWKENRLELLQEKLLQYFPPAHLVQLVSVSPHPRAPYMHTLPLEEMRGLKDVLSFNSTLFIPSIEAKHLSRSFMDILRRTR
jgi:uncharacterized protein YabN with tetrapyrrole methylase and pyrophosphatase domain